MNRNELKVGQLVTIGQEIQFMNDAETACDWVTDRWANWEITNLTNLGPDYATIELACKDGVYSGTVELDLDYADIEPAS